MDSTRKQLCADMKIVSAQMDKACDQVRQIDNEILQVKQRYQKAKNFGRLAFCNSHRLRLDMLERTRTMLYAYACARGDELEILQSDYRLNERKRNQAQLKQELLQMQA